VFGLTAYVTILLLHVLFFALPSPLRFSSDSSILIHVAMVGYGRQPEFELNRPGAPTRDRRLAWTMFNKPVFREACEKEGVRVDWALVKRIASAEGHSDGGSRQNSRGKRWRRGVWSKL
jgi:hypothetical protein